MYIYPRGQWHTQLKKKTHAFQKAKYRNPKLGKMKKTDPQNTANNAKAVVTKVWIWRAPAGLLRYKQRFETKASSAPPVSGYYWTSGTVITLHESDTVKTCTDTCSHKNKKFLDRNVQVSVIGIVVCLYTTCGFELSKNKTNTQTKTKNNNNKTKNKVV